MPFPVEAEIFSTSHITEPHKEYGFELISFFDASKQNNLIDIDNDITNNDDKETITERGTINLTWLNEGDDSKDDEDEESNIIVADKINSDDQNDLDTTDDTTDNTVEDTNDKDDDNDNTPNITDSDNNEISTSKSNLCNCITSMAFSYWSYTSSNNGSLS